MALRIKHWLPLAAVAVWLLPGAPQERPRTFANPINIEYRFMTELPSRREAADPAIVIFGIEIGRILEIQRHGRLDVHQALRAAD
jgi:hypothetical protein